MRPLSHARGCLCPECAEDSNWDRELLRSERHHDVLCLVLKQQLHDDGSGPAYGGAVLARMVQVAREAADLAYPPPRAATPHEKQAVENTTTTYGINPDHPSVPCHHGKWVCDLCLVSNGVPAP